MASGTPAKPPSDTEERARPRADEPAGAAPAPDEDAVTEAPGTEQLEADAEPVDAELGADEDDELAAARRERDEYLSLAQRAQADFENYRKRAAKDVAAAGSRAKAGLARELLPVVDNLERALASASEEGAALEEGVRLVHSELVAALERTGVESFAPAGEPFDPTLHDALSTRPDPDADAGVVVDVVEKGYRLDGTVLRPARVIVSA